MIGLDRIEADEPLERIAAGAIPKPYLEAGHRIVPTYQTFPVGLDRTDPFLGPLPLIIPHRSNHSQQAA